MSKKNRPLLSLRGEVNEPTTEQPARAPGEPNAHFQEKIMEAAQPPVAEKTPEPNELTAKEMARAEEENVARAKRIIDAQQERLARELVEPPTLMELAAQGMDGLHDALRAHNERPVPVYTPPPRTERQMSQLEEELEAGRRANARAAEQQASRPAPPRDPNEGFTTPVQRDGTHVPGINSKDPDAVR